MKNATCEHEGLPTGPGPGPARVPYLRNARRTGSAGANCKFKMAARLLAAEGGDSVQRFIWQLINLQHM